MRINALLHRLPTLATAVACIAIACVAAAPAVTALGKGDGKPATEEQVPAAAGYGATECTDLSDAVACGGEYVLGCCNSGGCVYLVTDGESVEAVFPCVSTSDCADAGAALLDHCEGGDSGGGGDTGYDSERAKRRLRRLSTP